MTEPTQQNEIITWTDSAGNVTPLAWLVAQNDPQVIWGRRGAYMPTPLFAKYVSPAQDGALVKFIRWQERELDLTVELFCDDITILKQRMGALTQVLNPANGLGKLTFTHENGISRSINCNLIKGMEGSEPLEYGVGFVGRMLWVFESPDVFFYDPRIAAAQTITIPADTTMGTAVSTTPASVVNAGTTRAWPIWTLTLPFNSVITNTDPSFVDYTPAMSAFRIYVSIVNVTTGDYLTFYLNGTPLDCVGPQTYPYTGTDTVRVIDTRSGIKTIKDALSTLVTQTLTFQNLFPLVIGTNMIRIDVLLPATRDTIIGGKHVYQTFASGTGSLSMVYQPAYLSIT